MIDLAVLCVYLGQVEDPLVNVHIYVYLRYVEISISSIEEQQLQRPIDLLFWTTTKEHKERSHSRIERISRTILSNA